MRSSIPVVITRLIAYRTILIATFVNVCEAVHSTFASEQCRLFIWQTHSHSELKRAGTENSGSSDQQRAYSIDVLMLLLHHAAQEMIAMPKRQSSVQGSGQARSGTGPTGKARRRCCVTMPASSRSTNAGTGIIANSLVEHVTSTRSHSFSAHMAVVRAW